MTHQPTIEVRLTHVFVASAERVFDAWLDVAMIGRFMFGPQLREEEVVSLSINPRVGGEFSFLVRRAGHEIDHVGEYLEIDRPHRLVFSWGIRENLPETSRVIVEIASGPTGCELTLTHQMDPKWSDFADRVRRGWTTMIQALDSTLVDAAK